MGRWLLGTSLAMLLLPLLGRGDEPTEGPEAAPSQPAAAGAFVLSDEVRDALLPLLKSIAEADVSRATVELTAESIINGQVVDSQPSTYQIASRAPDHFTVYLKEPDRRTRVYCDGKEMVVAMAPDAYIRAPSPIQTQRAVTELPVPMGPYPEAVLSLSLAGVDPAISLLGGMRSVELVDRVKFRGETPAVHFRGVQSDGVSWDFWMSDEASPRPLRFLVDLTAMLRASEQVEVPEGFSYQLRFDFLSWRMSGEVDPTLFTFTPAKDAVEYDSLDDYYQSMAEVGEQHPLLGKPAPKLTAKTVTGEPLEPSAFTGRVLVLSFWSSKCEPCTASVEAMIDVNAAYAERVVHYVVSTGETADQAKAFVQAQEWKMPVLSDTDGRIAAAFGVDAIPQTVVLGPQGTVQAVHIAFDDEPAFRRMLTEELDVLVGGGQLVPTASAGADAATTEADDSAGVPGTP